MSRFWRALPAWLALVAMAAGASTPLVSAHAGYDPDLPWTGPMVAADGQSLVTDANDQAPPEHCLVCHWMSAIGSAQVGGQQQDAIATASVPVPLAAAVRPLAATPLRPGPSRAPPVG